MTATNLKDTHRHFPLALKNASPESSANHACSMTLYMAYQRGVSILRNADIDNAHNEAIWILEATLDISRVAVYAYPNDMLTSSQWAQVKSALCRRAKSEPLQYIIGIQEFIWREFTVCPNVFIPRPETELVVKAIEDVTALDANGTIIDVGTGSGCIAISLALSRPAATIYAIDCNQTALYMTMDNARRHGVANRIKCVLGDGLSMWNVNSAPVSVLVSNPPYIPSDHIAGLPLSVRGFEPHLALDGGKDGLMWYRYLLSEGLSIVRPGGILVVEVGDNQAEDVCNMACDTSKWSVSSVYVDGAGMKRVVCIKRLI